MAQIYGGRWRNLGPLGGGGQGDVFRVSDESGELAGEYALKRLRDISRLDRFKAEVAALTRLSHPRIVRIIDYAIPPADQGPSTPSYLVMPMALEGDLTKRLALYKGSMEATVKVATQIAEALAAAHNIQVVHRDVKPANVLFPENGHTVWLCDFGISHVPDQQRVTRPGEIVGPRSFTAPELEEGGQLAVTGAADIYSLGKLIFYMLSGGTIVPREEMHNQTYSAMLGTGERANLIRSLLSRMVAPLERRITDMGEVIRELETIETWEERARAVPLSPVALAKIDQMQAVARTKQRITADNKNARDTEEAAHAALLGSLLPWLSGELEKIAAFIRQPGLLESNVRKATLIKDVGLRFQEQPGRMLWSEDGVELTCEKLNETFPKRSILQFWVCRKHGFSVQIGENVKAAPTRDLEVMVVPRVVELHAPDYRPGVFGFLNSESGRNSLMRADAQRLGAQRGIGRHSRIERAPPVSQSFIGGDITIARRFKTSEWPSTLDSVRALVTESLDVFMEHINSVNQRIGG